ncbi:hypothetical protein HZU77_015330 [Neisseriaceae bacterium TC5R-5]|nr:hypothetical protein [Neisseriaceae bacterium TC5R-5]
MKCSAQFPPDSAEFAYYQALEKEGAFYKSEQDALKNYSTTIQKTGTSGYPALETVYIDKLFNYTIQDQINDGMVLMQNYRIQQLKELGLSDLAAKNLVNTADLSMLLIGSIGGNKLGKLNPATLTQEERLAVAAAERKAMEISAVPTTTSKGVPPSILTPSGNLPPGVGELGTPIPMPASSNPSTTTEQFAQAAFNGQKPMKIVNNITGEGSWVAVMPDGAVITYRPASQASAKTAATTATVEINSAAIKSINNGKIAKFKFPAK